MEYSKEFMAVGAFPEVIDQRHTYVGEQLFSLIQRLIEMATKDMKCSRGRALTFELIQTQIYIHTCAIPYVNTCKSG